jgi:hypothetical protein
MLRRKCETMSIWSISYAVVLSGKHSKAASMRRTWQIGRNWRAYGLSMQGFDGALPATSIYTPARNLSVWHPTALRDLVNVLCLCIK